LVATAQELDLEKITSTNDYELSQVNRRTIMENGVTQVVCEIGQVPIKRDLFMNADKPEV
jgi:ribosomal protein S4E